MTSHRRQYPVFVYGTLRHGQGNYRRLLEGRTVRELPCIAKGTVRELPCIAKGLALFGPQSPTPSRSLAPGSLVT